MREVKVKNSYLRKFITLELEVLLNETILKRTLKKLRERGTDRKDGKMRKFLYKTKQIGSLLTMQICLRSIAN